MTMDPKSLLPFFVLALIIANVVIAIPAFRIKYAENKRTGKKPKGHYIGAGM